MYCGKCYTSSEEVKFHVHEVSYTEGAVRDFDKMRIQEVWKPKHRKPTDYHIGRNGDHLISPFECDLCIFRKIRQTDPDKSKASDSLLLAVIRRANLDVLWSRATSTVNNNRRKVKETMDLCDSLGVISPFIHSHDMPCWDHAGYSIAIAILMKSRKAGKHDVRYQQYDTIRQLRSSFSNFVRAAPTNSGHTLSLGRSDGVYERLNYDICSSLWFEKFMQGLRNRMGQLWLPNKGMNHSLWLKFIEKIEEKVTVLDEKENSMDFDDSWFTFYIYIIVSTLLSLRGSEGLLLSLDGIKEHWNRGIGEHMVISLFGKVKGESGEHNHLIPCCEVTASGLKVRQAFNSFLNHKKKLGITFGPAICDKDGKILRVGELDELLHTVLIEIFDTNQSDFPPDIKTHDDIKKHYQCFRTFRRTSDSYAREQNVRDSDITVVNRWKTVERAEGKRPSRPMPQHYLQYETLVKPFLRYTSIF